MDMVDIMDISKYKIRFQIVSFIVTLIIISIILSLTINIDFNFKNQILIAGCSYIPVSILRIITNR